MGLQLPTNSRDLPPPRGVLAVRESTRLSGALIAGLILVTLAYLYLLNDAAGPGWLADLPWILAPLVAAVGWAYAARGAKGRARTAFWAFQAAAVLGLGVHLAGALLAPYLLLLPPLAIAVGAALALGSPRDRAWTPRFAADTTLLLLAGLAGTLRIVVEPVVGVGGPESLDRTLLLALQVVTLVPVLLAAQVVLRRSTALSPASASLFLAATIAFALAALFSLARVESVDTVRAPAEYIQLGGWILFAAAGYRARVMPATAHAMLVRRRAPDAIRKLVVPGAALFLAVAVVDMGFGRPPRPETVLAVAMLGVVLALRTGQAFNLADREAVQRRQLAHTRALVSVTHALAGTTDLDQTLKVISESARSVFGTRGAGIELLTEDGQDLETRSVVGLPGGVVGLRFPIEGSFTGWVVQHEEPRATADPSLDPFIQPQSLSFLGRWPVAAAPIQFRGETLGALFACIRSEPFDAEELELMGALAEQAAIAIQHARLFEQITMMSITDPLTGLANRRHLERELRREFAAARRGRELSVVIFDLDRFKEYNDSNGHLAGDQALQAFAGALQDETRAMNLAARYGGDEFVAILSGSDMEGASVFIDRVRTRFGQAVEELGHGALCVSAGLAQYTPEMADPEALLRTADDELYRVKPSGRT